MRITVAFTERLDVIENFIVWLRARVVAENLRNEVIDQIFASSEVVSCKTVYLGDLVVLYRDRGNDRKCCRVNYSP